MLKNALDKIHAILRTWHNSTNRPFASLSHSCSSSSNAFISHNAPINSVGASLSSVLSNTMDEIRDVVIDLQHAKIKLIAHTSGSVSVNKVPIQCSCSWENGNGNQAILTMRWWLVHLVIGAQCQHTRTHTHTANDRQTTKWAHRMKNCVFNANFKCFG